MTLLHESQNTPASRHGNCEHPLLTPKHSRHWKILQNDPLPLGQTQHHFPPGQFGLAEQVCLLRHKAQQPGPPPATASPPIPSMLKAMAVLPERNRAMKPRLLAVSSKYRMIQLNIFPS